MCGVVGVIGSPEASREAFLALITLQHRGQDAAGILSYDQSFHLKKNMGLVENVFSREAIESLSGSLAIGHTRYSTIGKGELAEVQPFVLNYPFGIGLAHNGNLVNYLSLKDRLENEMHRRCFTHSDSEALLNWFAHHLKGRDFASLVTAASAVFRDTIGSYSVVGMLGGAGLFAFRDPLGIRPLVLGKKQVQGKTAYMVASETIPLSFLGYAVERDIEPGEFLFIDEAGQLRSEVLASSKTGTVVRRPCMFEWVYFAGAEGEIESTPVYGTRLALGRALAAQIEPRRATGEIEPDLVAAVPDTSRTAATALAEALGVPYREVLIKNRYIKRTFILGSQEKRSNAVDLKLNPVTSEIRGKNILLVDDSIVRGTTSRKIIELVRRAGAKKVYFVSTCPPIRYPCFYGIDFPNKHELVAYGRTEAQIAQELGADSVVYQNETGLVQSIREAAAKPNMRPCTACLDGKYPTDVSESDRFIERRNLERKG